MSRNNNKSRYNNRDRVNNVEEQQYDKDPPGICQYKYSSEPSDKDQQILDKFYYAKEDTCNAINTIETNPTWILPMYQCTTLESDFSKQKPIFQIDFLLTQEQN